MARAMRKAILRDGDGKDKQMLREGKKRSTSIAGRA